MDKRSVEELEREIVRLEAEIKFKDGLIWTSRVSELYKATFAAEQRAKTLEAENKKLRNAIINQRGDDLCWVGNPDDIKALPASEFLESCRRFHAQIVADKGEAVGLKTIAQLEKELAEYQQAFSPCAEHHPSVWEGQDACVMCEAVSNYVKLRTAIEHVTAITGGDATPFSCHNKDNECAWCGAEWTTPDWRLDPQPAMFGHPENGCLVFLAEPHD